MQPETIGQLTRRRRNELKMTQLDLAEATGMSQRWVSDLEGDGVKNPKPDTLNRLARALDLNVADFVVAIGHTAQAEEAKRIADALTFDPATPEAELIPLIREIDWDGHERELDMIKAQLELIVKAQRGEMERGR